MTCKCESCGAPQQMNETNNCIYCSGVLKNNTQSDDLIKDFIPIKYEFNQGNYSSVLKLTESYLKKDTLNIPCWTYKISAEFLYKSEKNQTYDFEILKRSLQSLLDLQITNSLSQRVIEKQILSIFEIIEKEYGFKNKVDNFVMFQNYLTSFFSSDFINEINEKCHHIFSLLKKKNGVIFDSDENDVDPLFEDAARLFVQSGVGSTSLIQRRMNLGYNRSGRLMDQLEAAGIVGPNQGSKGREVRFKTEMELEQYLDALGILSESKNISNDLIYENYQKKVSDKTYNQTEETNVRNVPSFDKTKKGCFIATATMGHYDHPVVLDLRMFRDNWLLKREWGIKFTNWYYKNSPKVASVIEKSIFLRKLSFLMIIKPLHRVSILIKTYNRKGD